MALTILVRSGTAESPPGLTFDAPRIVIGRGEGCEVRLPDPSVSHRHASIRQRGAEYIVLDEGSTNGTFVGPVRLSPQAPRVLKHGDLVRVGRVWLETRIEQVPPTQNMPIATRELALALVAEALKDQGESASVTLRVAEGPESNKELSLVDFDRPYVIGRGKGADLSIDDADLSRRHVEIVRRAERLFVKDLGSKNGSKLGDDPLAPNKETPWPPGKVLAAGAHRFAYEDPVRAALEELERSADEKLRADEAIAPPDAMDHEEADGEDDAPQSIPEPRSAAPVTRRPPRTPRPPAVGWTATDVLVAFIAIVVLGLSVAGLVWLVGAG